MGGLEFLRQLQRIRAHVRAQGAPMRDGQEIRELPSAAADLDDPGVVRDLFVQQTCEQPAAGLLQQRAHVVQVVVIRKRRFLVELFYTLGHVRVFQIRIVGRVEQSWNVILDRILCAGSRVERKTGRDDERLSRAGVGPRAGGVGLGGFLDAGPSAKTHRLLVLVHEEILQH